LFCLLNLECIQFLPLVSFEPSRGRIQLACINMINKIKCFVIVSAQKEEDDEMKELAAWAS